MVTESALILNWFNSSIFFSNKNEIVENLKETNKYK